MLERSALTIMTRWIGQTFEDSSAGDMTSCASSSPNTALQNIMQIRNRLLKIEDIVPLYRELSDSNEADTDEDRGGGRWKRCAQMRSNDDLVSLPLPEAARIHRLHNS